MTNVNLMLRECKLLVYLKNQSQRQEVLKHR